MEIRVAHLLDGRHFGGAEQMVRRLALASPAHGIYAKVYLLSGGRLSEFLQADGIPHEVFPSSGRFDFRPLRAIAAAMRRDGIQIIQAHTSRTHLFARILSFRLRIPNITLIQSPIALDENTGTKRHPLRAMIERAGRPWTQHICPVSREETERLIREENVPREKITWIPNGIEPMCEEELKSAIAETFTVAMIAQFRPRKGAEVLIRACGKFIRDGGSGKLLLIGGDEFALRGESGQTYLESLKQLAKNEGLDSEKGDVEFTGFEPDPWKRAADADIIALPSLFGEGLPLTLLEAMNHAKPILASDSAGNRECVENGVNGWLHQPGDSQALADQIANAAKRRAELVAMGRRGRELMLESFSINRVMDKWQYLYERLIRGIKKDR